MGAFGRQRLLRRTPRMEVTGGRPGGGAGRRSEGCSDSDCWEEDLQALAGLSLEKKLSTRISFACLFFYCLHF